ncbi:hypothetical protein BT96DRAFT_943949 [Gymnopus androsaceus JB14]|uniref:Uncharacterized protein n=1 Tax=Gymnopus androsaceus JB14 TaxID=1447944 RepID=A0A6A4H868_9AGAR|nr:hypothetical protein BT96DRAFT_943949 [Gymnopus androsaceus JB14]
MPAHKLYKTVTERDATRKASYQKYYEKHKESINERRCSQYNNTGGKKKLKSAKKNDKNASCPGRSAYRSKDSASSEKPSCVLTLSIAQPNGIVPSKDSPAARAPTSGILTNSIKTPSPPLQPAIPTSSSQDPCLRGESFIHISQYHPNTYERTLGLRLARQSLEAYYDSYIGGLGGNWTRFFDRLSNSFIESGNPDEIDKAFNDYKWTELCLTKRFRKLEEEAIILGDYEAIQEGRGMVERVKEVGEKLHEFYLANMYGSEDFQERVKSGDLKW